MAPEIVAVGGTVMEIVIAFESAKLQPEAPGAVTLTKVYIVFEVKLAVKTEAVPLAFKRIV